jgi:hypothetical protein
LYENELLSEISYDDVKESLSGKKTKKKLFNFFKQLEGSDDEEYDREKFEQKYDGILQRLAYFIRAGTPEDVSPAQEGAAANWLKNIILSDVKNVEFIVGGRASNMSDTTTGSFFERVSGNLELFFQWQDLIDTEKFSKDINAVKKIGDLFYIIDQTRPIFQAKQQEKDYRDSNKGTDVIYDGPEWKIIIPRNKGAACELGKGTDWCTAAPGLDFYEKYHSDEDPLFIFINKKDPSEKYQFHYKTNQFMNSKDESILGKEIFLQLHNLLLTAELPTNLSDKIKEAVIVDAQGRISMKTVYSYKQGAFLPGDYVYNEIWEIPKSTRRTNVDGPAFIEIHVNKLDEYFKLKADWLYNDTRVAGIYAVSNDRERNRPDGMVSSTETYIANVGDMYYSYTDRKENIFDLGKWIEENFSSDSTEEAVIRGIYSLIKSDDNPIGQFNKKAVSRIQELDKNYEEGNGYDDLTYVRPVDKEQFIATGGVIKEEEDILNEITVDQVVDTLSGNKVKKKIMAFLRDRLPDDVPESHERYLLRAIQRLRYVINSMTPEDIEDAQRGAAANWIKRTFLSDKEELKSITLNSSVPGSGFIDKVYNNLEMFFQMQDFIDSEKFSRDLNSYSTWGELFDVVDATKPAYYAKQKEKDYRDASQGTDIVYDGPEWQIIIPRNKGAACELGKGTDWCTAAPGLDYYEEYHSDEDPLFIFINKNKPEERYQFHYGTEQFMDKEDYPVTIERFIELNNLLFNNVSPLPKTADTFIPKSDGYVPVITREYSDNNVYLKTHVTPQQNINAYAYEEWSELFEDQRFFHNINGPAEIKVVTTQDIAFNTNTPDSSPGIVKMEWAYMGKKPLYLYGLKGHYVAFKLRGSLFRTQKLLSLVSNKIEFPEKEIEGMSHKEVADYILSLPEVKAVNDAITDLMKKEMDLLKNAGS